MNEAENVGGGMKTGAELLVSGLKKAGIELVLGIPGGTVIPLYDALYEGGEGLRFVLTRHEQSAAHIADGYAQETDVFNLTMPIVKHSFMAQRAGDIPRLFKEAA